MRKETQAFLSSYSPWLNGSSYPGSVLKAWQPKQRINTWIFLTSRHGKGSCCFSFAKKLHAFLWGFYFKSHWEGDCFLKKSKCTCGVCLWEWETVLSGNSEVVWWKHRVPWSSSPQKIQFPKLPGGKEWLHRFRWYAGPSYWEMKGYGAFSFPPVLQSGNSRLNGLIPPTLSLLSGALRAAVLRMKWAEASELSRAHPFLTTTCFRGPFC